LKICTGFSETRKLADDGMAGRSLLRRKTVGLVFSLVAEKLAKGATKRTFLHCAHRLFFHFGFLFLFLFFSSFSFFLFLAIAALFSKKEKRGWQAPTQLLACRPRASQFVVLIKLRRGLEFHSSGLFQGACKHCELQLVDVKDFAANLEPQRFATAPLLSC
jgi:hypothetical protein